MMGTQNNNVKYHRTDLYYNAIYGSVKTRNNRFIMHEKQKDMKKDFRQFENFLVNATRKSMNRQKLKTGFKIVDRNKIYKLQPQTTKMFIKQKKLIANNTVKYMSDDEIKESIKAYKKVDLDYLLEDIKVESIIKNGEVIEDFIQDNNVIYINHKINNSSNLMINNNSNINVEMDKLLPEQVKYDNKVYEVTNGNVEIENITNENICFDISDTNMRYKLKKDKNKKHTWIEIREDENDLSEFDLSAYDVFMSDEIDKVTLDDKRKNGIKILDKDRNKGRLKLKITQKELEEVNTISPSSNAYQTKMQRNALSHLMHRPHLAHKPLLTLSDRSLYKNLEPFSKEELKENDWYILKDTNRAGTPNQREFVERSLGTKDFMILEGPPGSGKTTAILELVIQLAKKGKKVLLAASTHVAVDNVLERIFEEKNEIVEKIFPLRMGDVSNISPKLHDISWEKIKDNIKKEYKNSVLESFNLVCGTTLGILKFPFIENINNRDKGITPIFDYLIIDEASKTTFQEFLVPAIFAKKWIIVGDIKQLAPYVEQNNLTPSIVEDALFKKPAYRRALYFKTTFQNRKNQKIKPDSELYIMNNHDIIELDKMEFKLEDYHVIAITESKLNNITQVTFNDIRKQSPICSVLTLKNTIYLVEDSDMIQSVLNLVPNKTLCFHQKYDVEQKYPSYLFRNIATNISRESFKKKKNLLTKDLNTINDWYSKKFEDEIIWRLIRCYELGNDENNFAVRRYQKYINSYLDNISEDKQEHYKELLKTLSTIAIPSIIMLLQEGIKDKSNNNNKTILNSGFTEVEKSLRLVSLEFQYRMHPEISRFPREKIYQQKALKDDGTENRVWKYNEYPRQAVWLDVSNAKVIKNQNEKEVKKIITELDKFIQWTEENPREDKYQVAILAFYKRQIAKVREMMQNKFKSSNRFNFKSQNVNITINTVDKFQGQEADITFLSMCRNSSVGFMDSINRVNVAITRAKHQLVIVGDKEFFEGPKSSPLLKSLAKELGE